MDAFDKTVRGARFLDSVPLHLKKIADGIADSNKLKEQQNKLLEEQNELLTKLLEKSRTI